MIKYLALPFLFFLTFCQSNHSDVIQYFEDGSIMAKGDTTEGKYTTWYYGGNIKSMSNYKSGILNGEMLLYHESGHIMQKANFSDGNLDGKFELYFENGNKKMKGNYLENKADGKFTSYYKNGKTKSIKNFKLGIKVGEWIKFGIDGQMINRIIYENNIVLDSVVFNPPQLVRAW